MKHKIQKVELFIGVIIFLGGLLTYGLGGTSSRFGCLWYNAYWNNIDFYGL